VNLESLLRHVERGYSRQRSERKPLVRVLLAQRRPPGDEWIRELGVNECIIKTTQIAFIAFYITEDNIMVISEEIPDVTPLSDSSASSSEYSSFASPRCGVECAVPSEFHDIPGVVGDESFFEALHCSDEKRVSFGDCVVRKYPVMLGDHPGCSMGPPITIGWTSFKTSVTSVDAYESKRAPRRHNAELQIGWIQRKRVLRRISAATDMEMREAASEAESVRRQRAQTVRMLSFECIEAPLQSLQRKIRRGLFGGK
jgi:hypothetical protein